MASLSNAAGSPRSRGLSSAPPASCAGPASFAMSTSRFEREPETPRSKSSCSMWCNSFLELKRMEREARGELASSSVARDERACVGGGGGQGVNHLSRRASPLVSLLLSLWSSVTRSSSSASKISQTCIMPGRPREEEGKTRVRTKVLAFFPWYAPQSIVAGRGHSLHPR